MYGFDYVIAEGDNNAVQFDLSKPIFTTDPAAVLRDRFDHVESLSGGSFNDLLEGDSRGHFVTGTVTNATTADALFEFDILNQAGIDRINGFGSWFGGARQTLFGGPNPLVIGSADATNFRDGNILMGGDGNDTIQGNGGYDLIDGDAYLNVRIGINLNGIYYSAESLNTDVTQAGQYAGKVYRMVGNDPLGEVDFSSPAFSGRSLTSLLLDRTINPAQMSIVREIKYDATDNSNIDTAVFHGTLAEYDIEGRTVNANGQQLTKAHDINGDGFISVHDRDDGVTGATVNGLVLTSRKLLVDDTDLLKNIELLKFSDQTLSIAVTKPPVLDLHAFDLVTTVTAQYIDRFNVQAFNNSNGTTPWNTSWIETNDGTNLVGAGQIQTNVGNTGAMRFMAGDGASITRAVSLAPGATTTLSYLYSYSLIDTGDTLIVEFAANGTDFVTVQTIVGAVATNASFSPTLASFSVNGTANSALRFTVSTLTDLEAFRIDDVSIVSGTTVQVPAADGTGLTSTYTEGDLGVRIALNSSITDADSTILLGAEVRLTNAQSLDILSIAGALPSGITSSFGPLVAGEVTLILSGSASLAAYRTAIEAVRFQNDSLNPDVTPRNIEVTVTDGDTSSVAAVATVNVISVNDAPVAVNDAIVTNITSGNIVIPEWVLLANDSDVDGPLALDIIAVQGAVGVNALSLTTTPGSVTLVDDGAPAGSFTYTVSDGGVGGTTNGAVTVTNTGYTTVADNFNGVNNATPSAANNSTGTTAWATSWLEANDNAAGIVANNIRTGQVQIDAGAAPGTNDLRFAVGDGASIARVVNLAGVTSATLSLAFDKNGIDVGEFVDVQFAADGVNFVTLNRITNTNGTNANGNAAGTLSLALTGALSANSAIRFVGSSINTAGEDIRIDNVVVSYGSANANVTAAAGNQVLIGNDAGSAFTGGAGNDTVFANGGDDIINWSVGDGRDFIDGGANLAAGDRFIVNGNGTVENFIVYARAEAIAAGVVVENAATEIVVTRNGVVVGELDNVEEITINTGAGADTVTAVGNFGPTSLFFNTITVNGDAGRDTIDSSLLTSAHRLVLIPGQEAMADVSGVTSAALVGMASMVDAHDLGNYGWAESRHGNALRNPMFDRVLAQDSTDFHQTHEFDHSALHHYFAADYLIL